MIFISWKRALFKYSSESTGIRCINTCVFLYDLDGDFFVGFVGFSDVNGTVGSFAEAFVHSDFIAIDLFDTHFKCMKN